MVAAVNGGWEAALSCRCNERPRRYRQDLYMLRDASLSAVTDQGAHGTGPSFVIAL